jgi:hypothetical protein
MFAKNHIYFSINSAFSVILVASSVNKSPVKELMGVWLLA